MLPLPIENNATSHQEGVDRFVAFLKDIKEYKHPLIKTIPVLASGMFDAMLNDRDLVKETSLERYIENPQLLTPLQKNKLLTQFQAQLSTIKKGGNKLNQRDTFTSLEPDKYLVLLITVTNRVFFEKANIKYRQEFVLDTDLDETDKSSQEAETWVSRSSIKNSFFSGTLWTEMDKKIALERDYTNFMLYKSDHWVYTEPISGLRRKTVLEASNRYNRNRALLFIFVFALLMEVISKKGISFWIIVIAVEICIFLNICFKKKNYRKTKSKIRTLFRYRL